MAGARYDLQRIVVPHSAPGDASGAQVVEGDLLSGVVIANSSAHFTPADPKYFRTLLKPSSSRNPYALLCQECRRNRIERFAYFSHAPSISPAPTPH
jgi:hypothetical protein